MGVGESKQWLEMKEGVTVEGVNLKGQWPETLLVVMFHHERLPGCKFAWHWPVWKPETVDQMEPDFDPHLDVYLIEHIAKRLSDWRDCEPGEVRAVGVLKPVTTLSEPRDGPMYGDAGGNI
jgi:hypothetical protein